MKTFIFTFLLSTTFAQASYYVECGEGEKFSFRAVSEEDKFTGRNGPNWNVSLESDWLPDDSATATVKSSEADEKILSIAVTTGSGEAETGKLYVVHEMYGPQPRLKIYTVGGTPGSEQIGEHDCVVTIK
jgi:hypothetical protein